jgi:hypothetical protein
MPIEEAAQIPQHHMRRPSTRGIFDGVEQPDNLASLDVRDGPVTKGGQDQPIEQPLTLHCRSQASCFTTVELGPDSSKGAADHHRWDTTVSDRGFGFKSSRPCSGKREGGIPTQRLPRPATVCRIVQGPCLRAGADPKRQPRHLLIEVVHLRRRFGGGAEPIRQCNPHHRLRRR